MKILSFQPASLYTNGGVGRLLRRLYYGKEKSITTMWVEKYNHATIEGPIPEVVISSFPKNKKWTRWKLRTLFKWLREDLFLPVTQKRIIRKTNDIPFDILHVINHGIYPTAFFTKNGEFKFKGDKELWSSFHDHYTTASATKRNTKELWQLSDRRFVISNELGNEYNRLFGERDFELITDGLTLSELSQPRQHLSSEEILIYFGGLLHLDYYPLFESFADALDKLSEENHLFRFVLRGTQKLPFLKDRKFTTEYREDFVSDEEIRAEIDAADILYLPIKINNPNFYLYSLSTKMIGYLGASGTIFYHGPRDSAANKLLEKYSASISCFSLREDDLVLSIKSLINRSYETSSNAKILAKEKFEFSKIQNSFWKS